VARRPLPVIQAKPISYLQAAAMRQAGRGSGVIDPTRTASSPETVQQLRDEFSGPGTAGYGFLSAALGKHLAAYVPGTEPPLGFHPDPLHAAMNAASLLPPAKEMAVPAMIMDAVPRRKMLGMAWAGTRRLPGGIRTGEIASRAVLHFTPNHGATGSFPAVAYWRPPNLNAKQTKSLDKRDRIIGDIASYITAPVRPLRPVMPIRPPRHSR
jgi:hypothetical protein